MADRSFVTKS